MRAANSTRSRTCIAGEEVRESKSQKVNTPFRGDAPEPEGTEVLGRAAGGKDESSCIPCATSAVAPRAAVI